MTVESKYAQGKYRENKLLLFCSPSSKFAIANETYKVKMGDILNKSDDTRYLGVILDT